MDTETPPVEKWVPGRFPSSERFFFAWSPVISLCTFRANIDSIALIPERLITMKRPSRQVFHLFIGIAVLSLLGFSCPVIALEPTLARLSFWVPSERIE